MALVGRRKERIDEVAREIGDHALAISVDVSQQNDIDRVISQTIAKFGAIHVLVNNAGVLHIGNAEQITEEQWDHTFNVNVRAVWLMSRAVLPHMRNAGGGSNRQHGVHPGPGRGTQSRGLCSIQRCRRPAYKKHGYRLRT